MQELVTPCLGLVSPYARECVHTAALGMHLFILVQSSQESILNSPQNTNIFGKGLYCQLRMQHLKVTCFQGHIHKVLVFFFLFQKMH